MKIDKQVLDDLNRGIILTGRLPEVHIKNLKTYPFIYFDQLKAAEVTWDINVDNVTTEPSTVHYKLTFEEGFTPDFLKERANGISNAVKTLMWKEVKVDLSLNGKEVNMEELNGIVASVNR